MHENVPNNTSKTDWERVDALTDAEIDTSEASPLAEEFFEKARWRAPTPSDSADTGPIPGPPPLRPPPKAKPGLPIE